MPIYNVTTAIQVLQNLENPQDGYMTSGQFFYPLEYNSSIGNLEHFVSTLFEKQGCTQLFQYIKKINITATDTTQQTSYAITAHSSIPDTVDYLHVLVIVTQKICFNIMHIKQSPSNSPSQLNRTLKSGLETARNCAKKYSNIVQVFQVENYNWTSIYAFLFQNLADLPFQQCIDFNIKIQHLDRLDKQDSESPFQLSQGVGVVIDMFRKFWNGATDPSLNWFEGNTTYLPCRLTQQKSIDNMRILGRVYASSIQHGYIPNHIHFAAYIPHQVYRMGVEQLHNAIFDYQPSLIQAIPEKFDDWVSLPVAQKECIVTQYHLYTILDDEELSENNYNAFRSEAFRQILVRHRSLSSQAFAKGIDDIYSMSGSSDGIGLHDNPEFYIQEWQTFRRVTSQDFQDMSIIITGDSNGDADMVYLHHLRNILKIWEYKNQKVLDLFQIFTRGSLGDRRSLAVAVDHHHKGLPQAHTCDPSLVIRPYQSLNAFMTDLERSVCELEMTLN